MREPCEFSNGKNIPSVIQSQAIFQRYEPQHHQVLHLRISARRSEVISCSRTLPASCSKNRTRGSLASFLACRTCSATQSRQHTTTCRRAHPCDHRIQTKPNASLEVPRIGRDSPLAAELSIMQIRHHKSPNARNNSYLSAKYGVRFPFSKTSFFTRSTHLCAAVEGTDLGEVFVAFDDLGAEFAFCHGPDDQPLPSRRRRWQSCERLPHPRSALAWYRTCSPSCNPAALAHHMQSPQDCHRTGTHRPVQVVWPLPAKFPLRPLGPCSPPFAEMKLTLHGERPRYRRCSFSLQLTPCAAPPMQPQ